ncbi:MAG: hypothetical protein DME25_17490, partial [Verrucomicrobia bacterium]
MKGDGTVVGWGDAWPGVNDIPPGLSNVVEIAVGQWHAVALKGDGTVTAWGRPWEGQLEVPPGLSDVVAIAAGLFHSLALRSDGTVVGWGARSWNQFQYDFGQLQPPPGVSNLVAVSTDHDHSLGLRDDGSVIAWGNPFLTNVPPGITNIQAVAASNNGMALRRDGAVLSWVPFSSSGQFGVALNDCIAIAARYDSAAAIQRDGSVVVAFGSGSSTVVFPQLPNTWSVALGNDHGLAVFAPDPPDVTTLQVSGSNGVALLNGDVNPGGASTVAWFEWGTNTSYGNATPSIAVGSGLENVSVSAPLTGLSPRVAYHYRIVATNSAGRAFGEDSFFHKRLITLRGASVITNECHRPFVDPDASILGEPFALAAYQFSSLALRTDGSLVGWGDNQYGQLNVPNTAANAVAIAAGAFHFLALKADGSVVGWGRNSEGQASPPADLRNAVAIAASGFHSFALKSDGSVVGWGPASTLPPDATNIIAIAAGGSLTLVVKADGTVIGYGDNTFGQITIPASATNVVAVAAGDFYGLALRSDGVVIGWPSDDPIPPIATNVIAISAGRFHWLALKADGSVVGSVDIPDSATNVVAIATGFGYSLAARADGSVIGWGYNGYYGELNIPQNATNLTVVPPNGEVDQDTPGVYTLTYGGANFPGIADAVTRTV